jgi:hypothetical protein
VTSSDRWISAEFQNLAEVLSDYDQNLALEMVPLSEWGNLIDKSKVFRVVDTKRNNIVMYFDSLVSPQDILARIWTMDQGKHNVVASMDARNAALQALEMKKHLDKIEAQKEFSLFIAKNERSRWKHEGRVRDEHFRDLGPVKKHIT